MPPMSSNKPHIRRAQIRRALEEAGRPVTRRQLSHVFGLDKAQSDQRLSPVLMEMVAASELVRNRRAAYGFQSQIDLVTGRFNANTDVSSFVMLYVKITEYYLSLRHIRHVIYGY